jgi:hypothetical protein
MHVDVIWYAPERMSYSCAHMFNEMLSVHDITHHVGYGIDSQQCLPKLRGAVIVFHGGNEEAIGRGPALAAILSAETVNYDWVIFVSLGDESDRFPLHLLAHKNFRLWAQTVKPGSSNSQIVDRPLIEGYPADEREILDSLIPQERDLHWFFAGQVTHERREQCVAALETSRSLWGTPTNKMPPEAPITSILIKTQSFGAGLSHESYYDFMRRALIVPCPAGPATPDSFRMAEALEAGAVPVLDAYALDRVEGYWDIVFPDHPFFVIEDWEKEWGAVSKEILSDWERHARAAQFFWQKYKLNFRQSLVKDMISLGAI